MLDDYAILDVINNDRHKKIIEKYVQNESNYPKPNICQKEHLVGKNYMSDENVTVFWIIIDKRYFLMFKMVITKSFSTLES